MALNFPSSPTVGQVYDMYSWDGEKWVPLPSASGGGGISEAPTDGGLYGRKAAAWARGVAVAGDTMSGDLGISKVDAQISLDKTSGGSWLTGRRNGITRWTLQLGNGETESGSNAGSNFDLSSWNDAGTNLASPIRISRATSQVTLSAGLVTGADLNVIRAGAPTTGAVLFGNLTNKYLYYDGANFALTGGHLFMTSQINLNNAGATLTFGGAASAGIYNDSSNIAIRAPATNGAVYFQDLNSAHTYGLFNAGGLSITGELGVSSNGNFGGTINVSGVGAQPPTLTYKDNVGGLRGYSTFDSVSTGSFFLGIHQASGQQLYIRGDGYLVLNAVNAAKPGGGSWADSSDERIKTVVGDYGSGLAQIKQLQPIRYTFKGNDTNQAPSNDALGALAKSASKDAPTVPYPNSPHYADAVAETQFVGLIAQNTEGAMPECVKQIAGYIDGAAVTDLRMLDTSPLVFALINAVKELSARVEQLEAAATP